MVSPGKKPFEEVMAEFSASEVFGGRGGRIDTLPAPGVICEACNGFYEHFTIVPTFLPPPGPRR